MWVAFSGVIDVVTGIQEGIHQFQSRNSWQVADGKDFDRLSVGMQNLGFHWRHTSDGQIWPYIWLQKLVKTYQPLLLWKKSLRANKSKNNVSGANSTPMELCHVFYQEKN